MRPRNHESTKKNAKKNMSFSCSSWIFVFSWLPFVRNSSSWRRCHASSSSPTVTARTLEIPAAWGEFLEEAIQLRVERLSRDEQGHVGGGDVGAWQRCESGATTIRR